MAVGAEGVGEPVGAAAIALAAGGTVARAAGPGDVGVDRHHPVAGYGKWFPLTMFAVLMIVSCPPQTALRFRGL